MPLLDLVTLPARLVVAAAADYFFDARWKGTIAALALNAWRKARKPVLEEHTRRALLGLARNLPVRRGPVVEASSEDLPAALCEHLRRLRKRSYVAFCAYFAPGSKRQQLLDDLGLSKIFVHRPLEHVIRIGDPRPLDRLGVDILAGAQRGDAVAVRRARPQRRRILDRRQPRQRQRRVKIVGQRLQHAVARCAGWIAHAIEQGQSDTLIRPRARYVGPDPETV